MAEEFIDISDIDLNDTFEPKVLEKGTQVTLRIVSCLVGKDKNGNKYIMPFFDCLEEPRFKEFGQYLPLVHDGMSPKEANNAKLDLGAFSECFDVDFSKTVDIKNEMVGNEGDVILGVGKDQDGKPVNKIDKYL